MHSLLFESSDWRETGDWQAMAKQANVPDLGSFEECILDEATQERLVEDRRLAEALEVTGTPTFFYRFGAHVGFLNEEQLHKLVESQR